jgi:hypothetical protein
MGLDLLLALRTFSHEVVESVALLQYRRFCLTLPQLLLLIVVHFRPFDTGAVA